MMFAMVDRPIGTIVYRLGMDISGNINVFATSEAYFKYPNKYLIVWNVRTALLDDPTALTVDIN